MASRFVYLHGFASGPTSKKAAWFRGRFAQTGRALEVPDLAAGDFENLTITGQLRVLRQVMGGQPAFLIGSSLGGYLAALYAARHADVEQLVLLAPAFQFPRRWPERLGDEAMAQWRDTGVLSVFHYGEQREQALRYAMIEDAAQYEDTPAVTQPALVFHGTRDDVVPPDVSLEFARVNPQVDLRLVDSDHELMDVRDEAWQAIETLL